MSSARFALGVDVGGTFTDLELVRLADGRAHYHKVASTPDDPSRAVAEGMRELLTLAGVAAAEVAYFGHGTTVATNALITGKTALTGLVTTEGFRDLLEIRRQRQPHNYNIRVQKPTPPVARALRREVPERTFLFGPASIAPEKRDLEPIAQDFRRAGVDAVAVCFLHSYHNPEHEAQVVGWIREMLPGAFVSASHEVVAEFREYERLSTTVLNAALGPVMTRYLSKIAADAKDAGLPMTPAILQSNGGVASPEEAGRLPVRTLASGPAAGVTGAVHLALAAGIPDIITFDVGGTSTDVCLVEGGTPLVRAEREFVGYPVRFPMVDVHSVGAGGGSIARVDAGGFLDVGPASAGARPGPAGYGLGGTEPTVTDANLVLGRLNPETLLGGRMAVRLDLAQRAMEEKVAGPMGLSVEDAAEGILTILNETVMQAIRVISVEQGYDPRDFTLLAFGGAGPLLASLLARELGMAKVIVPERPGILCAQGLLVADVRADFGLTRIMPLERTSAPAINAALRALRAEAEAWFRREGVPGRKRRTAPAIDMRYIGQSHELRVPVADKRLAATDIASIEEAFIAEHERVYGYAPRAPVQLVTFRVRASAEVTRAPAATAAGGRGRTLSKALIGRRQAHFRELGRFVDCPVYDRARLPGSARIDGPAILEQMDATTVVLPGQTCRPDRHGNLVLTFGTG